MAADAQEPPVERATTALVYRAVDDLGKRVDAHFDGVKQRLDRLEPMEGRVDGHDSVLANHEVRILNLERDDHTRDTWVKVSLPPLIISTLALVAAVVLHLI